MGRNRIASAPFTSRTTTRFSTLPTPRMADCGWLITIGDAVSDPDTPWFESLLSYDPAKVLERVRQPLLFVHGQLDKQIPVAHVDRLAEIARKSGKSKVIDVVAARGVNHLLVPAITGEEDEYATLGDPNVSKDVTGAVTTWLSRTLGPASRQ